MIFLRKLSPIYVLLRVIKGFLMTIMPKIDTERTRFSKNLAKSALWSGQMPISALLVKKTDLKLGQCQDIDDMTSTSKFGKFT